MRREVIIICLIIVLSTFLVYLARTAPFQGCTAVKTLNSSITVVGGDRAVIGLNADRDSLKFGTVSALSRAKRVVYFNHSKQAKVEIIMKGDISPWITITPRKFFIPANEMQEISFVANVPGQVKDGDYSGEVYFCVREEDR